MGIPKIKKPTALYENLKAINQGLQNYLDGKTHSHSEVIKMISKKKAQMAKKPKP